MSLHLDIVTPEKKIFSDRVDYVYLPGSEGELGILTMHADLVTSLKPGELRFMHAGHEKLLAIGSGFAEVGPEKVVVLTDMALGESEIDEAAQEEAIERARKQLEGIDQEMDFEQAAQLQALIAQSSAALQMKRKFRRS